MGAMGLGQMFSLNPAFASARVSAAQMEKIINRSPTIDPNPTGVVTPISGAVTFRNVRFTYRARPTEEVIRGINLNVDAGMVVGVVGHSGSGKSTLISLLERFYEVESGAILVDGIPMREYNLDHLRRNIGLVAQEPTLFDTTIEENIRFGKWTATQEEVEEAARKANAHQFIQTLPKGYQTMCGEGGHLLSGGQKQRIAIARAVLKDPKILLLDEATSALDAESEALVQEALQKLMRGRTTIVVAHRLSTIRDSDVIVVLDKGRIVEQGKHMELLLRRSFYFLLISKQMAPEDLRQVHRMADAIELEDQVAE
jgi:ATP-binding cassette subfamily B (MDR/TAP) protein 1